MSDQVIVRVAVSLDDAEGMRIARNDGREFMTRHPFEISREEQAHWFTTLERTTTIPFVARILPHPMPPDDACIGYGLVRLIDGQWWLSGGLRKPYRGKGYGKILFAELTKRVHDKHKPAWLEVRKDNEPAFRTYRSLGFTIHEELDAVFVMKNDRL